MDVSDPTSKTFGQHWSQDEVVEMFKPSDESVAEVSEWLRKHGIASNRIVHSDNKQWLAFDASVDEAESLLKTSFYEEEKANGRSAVSADLYHLPQHLQAHIDYVTPGVKGVDITQRLSRKRSTLQPVPARPLTSKNSSTGLENCDKAVTPACIRALYNFEAPAADASVCTNNSLGIYELGDVYDHKDLDLFFNRYTNIPNGTYPILKGIDGGKAPGPASQTQGEAVLDFELAIPIVYPQTTTLYQDLTEADAGAEGGIFNTFLDAIDGSYCTYSAFGETGNEPNLDPTFPSNATGGYKGQLQCGVYKPTNVISISYGLNEQDLPAAYQQRQCKEYLKLGLQGVSVLIASGDYGVAGTNGCIGPNEDKFQASQPNGCPWITDVGASQIKEGNSVYDPEVAWPSSGGGFSNIFSAPAYQKDAIGEYFNTANVSYPYYYNGTYNNNGTGRYNRNGRGIPDVAAVGETIATYTGGEFLINAGTSASCPIFAALINRVIEERIKVGKGPLGFLNPTLYEHPEVFNDITVGNNPGCGTKGFPASKGWDPVTGLGTPNYQKILDLYLSLP
ncbi:subtilisin-like protein [Polychaeton citri CBS 116435]|uniref:Subtilisin-like protein n=1 Tax=Polychaeton citri CBS 116435 TaxID=1314669 RepID=A0A9P4QFR0_9PEZI|nr:subtilisin-like protein [Polychaeton citri CBS 116435]